MRAFKFLRLAGNREDILQIQIMRMLRVVAPDLCAFAVPNGGYRNPIEARKLKDMGVLPGVSDIAFILPGGRFAGVELKAGKGKQTPAQMQFQDQCARLGAPYAVCRSWEEVEAFLRGLGVPFRSRSPE